MGVDTSAFDDDVYMMDTADFLSMVAETGVDVSMLNTTYDIDTLYSWYMSQFDYYMYYDNFTDFDYYMDFDDYWGYDEYMNFDDFEISPEDVVD